MNYIEVELTPDQKLQWTNAKTLFLWRAPGFAHVMITMLNPNQGDGVLFWTKDIPTLATDGERILANPEYFFSLSLQERIFALGHETSHAILDHLGTLHNIKEGGVVQVGNGKTKPLDPEQANWAMDFVVNDMLVQSNIGECKKEWLHDTKIATQDSQWAEVYGNIYKPKPKSPPGGGKSFDQHLPPGAAGNKTPQQGQQARQQAQQRWKNAVGQAKAITQEVLGKGQGSLSQQKFFEQFLEPAVSWVDQVTGTIARKVGGGGYDYRKFDRRLITRDIVAPGRSGRGVRRVVIAGDSSGSIYGVKDLIDRFFAEMMGIFADLRPREMGIVWCDSSIKAEFIIEDEQDLMDCKHKGVAGGGGTSFVEPFDWVKKQGWDDVDCLIYLTDLEGDFPEEAPPYPVIWCTIKDLEVPFGDKILIPSDGSA